jgi:SM-20-related protein
VPRVEYFRQFGIFSMAGFLGPASCLEVIETLRGSPSTPAVVVHDDFTGVEERERRSRAVRVPASLRGALEARFAELLPVLADEFRLPLAGWEPAQFLAYRTGDFFAPHRDAGEAPEATGQRRVSVVLFLNAPSDPTGSPPYGGGEFLFWGLQPDPRWPEPGMPMPLLGEAGLLIAFPSNLLHSVRPVTYGERYSIVTWFY